MDHDLPFLVVTDEKELARLARELRLPLHDAGRETSPNLRRLGRLRAGISRSGSSGRDCAYRHRLRGGCQSQPAPGLDFAKQHGQEFADAVNHS